MTDVSDALATDNRLFPPRRQVMATTSSSLQLLPPLCRERVGNIVGDCYW